MYDLLKCFFLLVSSSIVFSVSQFANCQFVGLQFANSRALDIFMYLLTYLPEMERSYDI